MNRRVLLRAAAALAAPALTAAETPMRFGFSLYGMRPIPVPDALRLCRKIGYQSVEFALMKDWPTAPENLTAANRRELRGLLDGLGMRLAGLMENLNPLAAEPVHADNLERLKRACELAHALSPTAPPPIETILGGKPGEWDETKERMAGRLASWARVMEAGKITLAMKPHVGNALHSPEGALWLLGRLRGDRMKLAYDFSHYELRGWRMEDTMRALIPHSVFVHIKDGEGSPGAVRFLLPGDGRTDYGQYLRLLYAAGYRGDVVVEVSAQIHNRPEYDPAKAAERCYRNLAPAFAAMARSGRG